MSVASCQRSLPATPLFATPYTPGVSPLFNLSCRGNPESLQLAATFNKLGKHFFFQPFCSAGSKVTRKHTHTHTHSLIYIDTLNGARKGKEKKLWQRESFTTKLELKQLNAVLFCKILDRGVRSFDQQIVKFYARPFGEILF